MSADKIFEALSSAPRRRILAYLSKTEMMAGEIAERFADMMLQPAISKHLSVPENAGLVWREKRGTNVHYGLKEDALTGTHVHFLDQVAPIPQRQRGSRQAEKKERATEVNIRLAQFCDKCGTPLPSMHAGDRDVPLTQLGVDRAPRSFPSWRTSAVDGHLVLRRGASAPPHPTQRRAILKMRLGVTPSRSKRSMLRASPCNLANARSSGFPF
jgi:ArsR family transcriptional regulator